MTRRLSGFEHRIGRTPRWLLLPQTMSVAAATSLAMYASAIPQQATWFASAGVATLLTAATWRLRTLAHSWHALVVGRHVLRTEFCRREVSEARQQLSFEQQTNQWLRRLANCETFNQALIEVMRQLIPSTGDGFVAWLDCTAQPTEVTHCRGLSSDSKRRMRFDHDWQTQTIQDGACILQGHQLRENALYDALTREDRRNIEAVYLFELTTPHGRGVLISSRLLPFENPFKTTRDIVFGMQRRAIEAEQLEAVPFEASQTETPNHRTHSQVETPLDLLEDFIDELREMTSVDRVALIVGNFTHSNQLLSVATSSRDLPPNVHAEWTRTEQKICRSVNTTNPSGDTRKSTGEIVSVDSAGLQKIGINILIGHAWLVPIRYEDQQFGVLCLTNQSKRSLSETQQRWAIGCATCIAGLFNGLRKQSVSQPPTEHLEDSKPDSSHPTPIDSVDELAVLSHEIRNPMNGVLAMVRLALQTDLTAEQREYLDIVRISSESLLETVNGVLEHATDTDHPPTTSEVNLDQLLSEVLKTFAAKAAEKGIELIGHRPPNVPDRISIDRRRLRQVLINLVANSVKFTESGEVLLTIAEAERHDDPGMRFIVRDTGVGIPLEKQQQIFEPFVQAEDDTKARFGGTGLGLAVSRDLVRELGGEIGLQSQLGQGTTFEFSVRMADTACQPPSAISPRGSVALRVGNKTLDRCLAQSLEADGWSLTSQFNEPCTWEISDESDASRPAIPHAKNRLVLRSPNSAASKSEHPATIVLLKPVLPAVIVEALRRTTHLEQPAVCASVVSHSTAKQNLRVLIADDDRVNQHVNRAILERLATTVDTVESGETAVLAFMQDEYDVVVLDRKMQGIDGFETARKLRSYEEQTTRTPAIIVLLSGFIGPHEQSLASTVGIDECLVKPLDESRIAVILTTRSPVITDNDQRSVEPPTSGPKGLTPKLAQLLQAKFLEDWPELKDAVENQDFPRWEAKAHSLKGAVTCIQWDALEVLLHSLEMQARVENPEIPTSRIEEIDQLILAFIEPQAEPATPSSSHKH